MIEIGKKLKNKREELNLSYEDVSAITKLSIPHLKAIENGDLDYFREDLSYIRFYVRAYCKVVDVPYENFKDDIVDSIDEYTTTMSLKRQEMLRESEKAIREKSQINRSKRMANEVKILEKEDKGPKLAKKDRASINQNAQKARFRKKSGLDFSMLSFILVILLVLSLVIFVGAKSLFNDDTPPKEDPQVNVDNDKEPTPPPITDPVVDKEEPRVAVVEKTDALNYVVKGLKVEDPILIEIAFVNNNSWFEGYLNNVAIPNVASKIYYAPEVIKIDTKVNSANDVYRFVFGYYMGTKIKINGVEVNMDPALNSTQATTITFTLKGE